MNTLLQELIGQTVKVYSEHGQGEASDVGVLQAVDDHWLRLDTDAGVIYFCLHRVRLVKAV